MNIYVFQALNGLGVGMIYFLLSVGLSIIFGLLGFVNFAHGALFLVGAYTAMFTTAQTGSFVLGLAASFAVVALVGVIAERLVLRRTYKMPHESQILITVGLTFILTEAVVLCVIGGVAGIVLGRGSSYLVTLLLHWPTAVSVEAIVAAVVVSATVGILFGYYPAWKASRLDPIEALRYE